MGKIVLKSDIETVEGMIEYFFPGIRRYSHFESCTVCSQFKLCDLAEEGRWICAACQYAEERTKSKSKNWGYVYVLGSRKSGYFKIGASKNPSSRLAHFRSKELPFDLQIVHQVLADDKFEAERRLHKMFRGNRTNGEWFKLNERDISRIQSYSEFREGRWIESERALSVA